MNVSIRYMAQLKHAAGVAREQATLDAACSPHELVTRRAACHGEALHRLLLDGAGRLHPTILLFVGDEQATPAAGYLLKDGDQITVLAPIAGG